MKGAAMGKDKDKKKRQKGAPKGALKGFLENDLVEIEESQVTTFGFASGSVSLGSEGRIEILVEATPEYDKKKGTLGYILELGVWLIENEDSCCEIFSSRIPKDKVQKVLSSGTPAADALESCPKAVARLEKGYPSFAGLMRSVREKQTLGAGLPSVSKAHAKGKASAPGRGRI